MRYAFIALLLLMSCTAQQKLSMRSVGSVESKQHDDIRGKYLVEDLVFLYKGMSNSFIGQLLYYKLPDSTSYQIKITYTGTAWGHFKQLLLNVDGEVVTLKSLDRQTDVNSTSGSSVGSAYVSGSTYVTEYLYFHVDGALQAKLMNAKAIRLQIEGEAKAGPWDIGEEGINGINGFMATRKDF